MAKKETLETATSDKNSLEALQADMISMARKMCAEINDGSARDYYQHIESIIKLHNAVRG